MACCATEAVGESGGFDDGASRPEGSPPLGSASVRWTWVSAEAVLVDVAVPADEGPWNDFKVSAPMQVTQFEGLANFDTMGAGPFTINELNLPLPPPGVKPISIKLNTGTTFGGGFSTGVGGMVRTSSARPYKGP